MVDEETPAYRPRRAFPAEEPPNDEPTVAVEPQSTGRGDRADNEPTVAVPAPDEDAPKPLYRDEVGGGGDAVGGGEAVRPSAPARPGGPRRSATSPVSGSDQTQILSRARERARAAAGANPPPPRSRETRTRDPRSRRTDADATTMLPRTVSGARVSRRPDVIDDDPGADNGGRSRTALWVGIVAAVVVVGLAVGYLIINLTKPTATPGSTSPPPGPSATQNEPSATPSASVTAILSDASMVTAEAAKGIDSKRTWKVARTQKGLTADSATPACLGGEAPEGQPDAQQTILRLVSADGSDAPGLLHEALAYTSPEEAAQAYALMAKTVGGCEMTGAYITQGRAVTGLGDQATGVVVSVTAGGKQTLHSLVLARTGRVVDVLDVARPKDDVSFNRTVEVLGAAIGTQCAAAGGKCADDPTSKTAPPPIGGDEPGYLAVGDLPPVGSGQQVWVGVTPGLPDDGNKYSNCETVNFAKTDAESRAKRTYLLQDDSSRFGLDEVVIAAKSDKAAGDLAEKIKDDWDGCKDRGLTATVTKPAEIDGVGAKSSDIAGWSAVVSQKTGSTTVRYRVGVVSVDNKVVFTFLNPKSGLDLSDEQFDLVTVRAGQRATQV